MAIVDESNLLVPNGTFFVELAVYGVMFALLILWPLVGAVMRRQWGWLVLVVLFGPFAGVLWFFMGRRASNRLGGATVHQT